MLRNRKGFVKISNVYADPHEIKAVVVSHAAGKSWDWGFATIIFRDGGQVVTCDNILENIIDQIETVYMRKKRKRKR